MKEEYHKWQSYQLYGEFEMLVFGHDGYPVIFFPTSCARYYQAKDAGIINTIEHLLETGKTKIYCPDSVDSASWYNYSIHPADRVKTHNGYENLILKEVIDFARHETGFDKIGVAGFCFGAFHALNLALRHPDIVDSIICLGGSFDTKRFIYGYYDDNCYFNSPLDYLPGLEDEWYLEKIRQMKIYFACGEFDPHIEENKRITGLFYSKNINYQFDIIQRAGHDYNIWRSLYPQYLNNIIQ